MSKEIDWSKAPEGYPVWIQDLTGIKPDGSGWHREETATYDDEPCERWTDVDGKFWPKDCEARGRISVHRKPVEVWTGTGLPPVGESCEYFDGGEWMRCEVVAHRNNAAVVLSDCYEAAFVVARELRPIRTQAQIEAEEREKALQEIEELIAGYSYGRCAELIYEAGYRKTEASK